MKIAVISTSVFPVPLKGYGGLEQLAWQQAEGLAQRGHDVTLFVPEASVTRHAKLFNIGPVGGDEVSAYSRYWHQLPYFDVVIDNSWLKASYQLKKEGVLKAPVLGVCHAPVNTMYQSLPPVEKPSFVCISHDQAKHFEALFSREAKVAYNGVDVDHYQPMSGVNRTNRFLFLARFSSVKSPDTCLDVCAATGSSLDLVGDTSITNEPELLEICKRKCDGDKLRMVGPAPRGECVRWFTQARALLHLNHRFREPFGLAPVEAQLCGTPVLGWDFGALRETVVHGETGFLVKSRAQAEEVIRSNALDDLKPGRCREWAMKFSIENMIMRYERLCVEVVETGGW